MQVSTINKNKELMLSATPAFYMLEAVSIFGDIVLRGELTFHMLIMLFHGPDRFYKGTSNQIRGGLSLIPNKEINWSINGCGFSVPKRFWAVNYS